ncbi:hypothetical protein E2542_SST09473 [Spatholobus suberectus]|nr:hypothetical protein E2542_SST09473 [Spatholobus suberectus]
MIHSLRCEEPHFLCNLALSPQSTVELNQQLTNDIENDLDAQSQDCYIAVEALCEVLNCKQPLIVYFLNSSQCLHKLVPKSNQNEFIHKVKEMFDRLSGPIVLICGQNKVQSGSKEKEQFTMILPNIGRVAKLVHLLCTWSHGMLICLNLRFKKQSWESMIR